MIVKIKRHFIHLIGVHVDREHTLSTVSDLRTNNAPTPSTLSLYQM